MDISFENVTVKTKQGKEILSNVGGSVKPGTFTSLMGASGSGKTTLLSTLSRRFEASLFYEGNVRYNGRKWTARDRRAISFVQQDDVMPTYLTVEEFLQYSARLRLDMPDDARMERVERVIAKLRLTKCRGTVIGDAHARGVSGGERKRTNIANELLTEPQVIFTDEPTSGLDSTLSNVVIEILKGLTNDGLTVVTTIHSPSSFIFSQFDSLIVLDEGRVFYRGEAKNLTNYINDTLDRTVPPQFNPADYLMDLLVLEKDFVRNSDRLTVAMASFTHLDSASSCSVSPDGEQPELPTGGSTTKQGLAKRKSNASTRGKKLFKSVSVIFRPGQQDEDELELSSKDKKFARSFPVQVYLLTSRLWQKHKKDVFTTNQIASTLGLSVISGLLFFQIGYTEKEIFSRVALSLWLVGTDMYLGVFSTSFALQDDIPLVKKEIYDGSYSLAAHVFAKQLALYPNSALWSMVFCILVLASSRLTSSVARAVLAILTVQAEVFLFQGVGFLISAGVPTSGLVVVAVVVVTFFFAFNGFFAPFALMADWYRWLRWPCFLVYPYQIIMRIVFSDENIVYQCNSPSAYTSCTLNRTSPGITGAEVLAQWDVDLSVATCLLVILLGGLGIRILSYFVYRVRMAPPKGIPIDDATDRKGKTRKWWPFSRSPSNAPDQTKQVKNQEDHEQRKDDIVQVV